MARRSRPGSSTPIGVPSSAFAASSAHADALWAGVTAEHLEQELRPGMDGERGMSMVLTHLQEHAEQISAS